MIEDAIHIFAPGNPPTATMQQKGEYVVGRHVVHFTKPRQREALAYWERVGRLVLEKHGGNPYEGAVSLSVSFRFKHPTSVPKIKRQEILWKSVRPDLDNLVKGLLDGFSAAGVWKDDAQVVSLYLSKHSVPETEVGTQIFICGCADGDCVRVEYMEDAR